MVAHDTPERQIIHIRLSPSASKNAIGEWVKNEQDQTVLKISVTTVPENGKANIALIKLLSKEWNIPKSSIVIEKGKTDRNKILSVPQNTVHIPE
ncbi:MAG: hypothetical protein AUJ12_03860 [Alphaproteobacteria bacterium CG1_02_46_17]|nr:MAG: hypothetical protein AUJ12_03860 [Alphaproteobacteria bacterium CG1_02_46_17]